MPSLRVGRREIEYALQRSSTATERRITVTPGHVEVLALADDDEAAIAGFLERKRQWLYTTLKDMEAALERRHAVPRFMTGSKIPYRGRKMPLTVRRTDAERASVTYRNGFHVDLPEWAGEDTDTLVASELRHWLRQRARQDAEATARRVAGLFDLRPRSIRTADSVHGWGSCGPEGNILINWHLVFAPRRVMDYVVTHELAHLRHRSHGREFWSLLATLMPDYDTPKGWLERNGASLDADFLQLG
ncbi:MAG: SprT family zinc-dependent metalloprotease [Pseudomonadota bacterium]|nr:SprT family zinc-dependent metalloprotease [Pseudomonadota bacterium]